MLVCHGSLDPLVPRSAGRAAFEACQDGDRPAEWREYPMGHQVCLEEVEAIRDWLHARLREPLLSS